MIVTDSHIAKLLIDQRIDVSDVEFWHDYGHRDLGKEHNPYAKFYRNTKTNARIMAVSGLPMVNANGDKICGDNHNETKVGWILKTDKYVTNLNIFEGTIKDRAVELITLNDQPTGVKKGASASWEPRLFLNGVEQSCGKVTLLSIDPVNLNYHNNVLEWDYGICKRRIRIIEGRFRERWIFPTNPNGDVLIKHNFLGDYKPKLGIYAVNSDEEFVLANVFNEAVYPFEVGTSQTFNPDDHIESTSVDGYADQVYVQSSGVTWATIVGAAGSAADDTSDYVDVYFKADDVNDRWMVLRRSIILYDTSGLPDAAVISAATQSIYGEWVRDTGSYAPDINVYASAPANNNAVVAGDFDSLGVTAFCNTPIAYGNWKIASPFWNDFIYNAAGIAAIPTDDVHKSGLRNVNYDVEEEASPPGAPTWSSLTYAGLRGYSADKGTGFKPKLVVTYVVPGVPVADGDLIGIGVIRKS